MILDGSFAMHQKFYDGLTAIIINGTIPLVAVTYGMAYGFVTRGCAGRTGRLGQAMGVVQANAVAGHALVSGDGLSNARQNANIGLVLRCILCCPTFQRQKFLCVL